MSKSQSDRKQLLIALSLALGVAGGVQAQQSVIETVQVTGTSINPGIEGEAREIATIPGGVTLIDGAEMRERNISTLVEMLRFVPGVWASTGVCADCSFFSSRGSNLDSVDYDGNGVKLLQDGLPVTTADGNNHNRAIDPLSAQYATFARGANAMSYGASTLGGAINFVSPTAHDLSPVELFVNGGSHGLATGRATVSKVFNEKFDALFTLDGKTWDGFREHNDVSRIGVYTNAGWNLSNDLTTRFYGTYLNNDQELTGQLSRAQIAADRDQANPSATEDRGNFQLNVETWRAANRTSWQIDETRRLDLGVSFEEQHLYHPIVDQIMVDFDGPGPLTPVEVFSLLLDTDHKMYGSMLRYNQISGAHDILLGINLAYKTENGGQHRNLHGEENGVHTLIDSDATGLEAYLLDRWTLDDNWMLTYGAQVTSADRDVKNITVANGSVRNPTADYSSLNPRLGAIYALDEHSNIYASISRTYEAPTNFQLEDNVAGGNAVLDPMKGTVLEIGTRGMRETGSNSGWNWDLALYYGWLRDEILSVDDPLAPGTSLATNIDKTVHAGVEAVFGYTLALDSAATNTINPRVSFTLNEFRFDNDATYADNRLPVAPEYVINGEVLYRNVNGFFAGPTFDFVGDRFADFTNTYEVNGYALLGLRTGIRSEKWKVFAEVKNLLDDDYIAATSARNVAFARDEILSPGEPLSVYAGMQVSF